MLVDTGKRILDMRMAVSRTYGEACAAASALDLVGERWALLVVRELLLGPKRFTDLQAGLRNASPNVISERLRELERTGVVRRRRLPPPAGSWVYELTAWGAELEPVLMALGRWGRGSPFRDTGAGTSVDAVMLALRSRFESAASAGLNATYDIRIGEDAFSVRVANRRLTVQRARLSKADAAIETDTETFAAVLTKSKGLREAIASGHLTLTGDVRLVVRLIDSLVTPEAAPAP